MNKSDPLKFVPRLVIGIWPFLVISAALWLWFVMGEPIDNDMRPAAATASAVVVGLAALVLGILVAVERSPLSPKIISTFIASLAVCAWTGYVLWIIDRTFSGTWPY